MLSTLIAVAFFLIFTKTNQMKNIGILIVLGVVIFSCKQKEDTKTAEPKRTPAEKIAYAHGIEHWNDVKEIQFTFNVDRDTTHFERSWIWKPKTDDVVMVSEGDTIHYNRSELDSISTQADKAFINDKYWLLAPFQLVWDTSAERSETSITEAPISKAKLHKITLTYPNEGGYTPGDAYDFYYNDDFIVQEWNYRKGNSKDPTMSTTWEDYKDVKGLHIGTTHNRPDADWKLYFTNIKVLQ